MNRTDFRLLHRLRVRWAEVDMQKIVFNAHYLMYLDTAIADYWRALALPYEDTMHQLGGDVYLKKSTLEFHASARMDDVLDIGMRCTRIGSSSMTFTAAIFRGEALLISAELVYVYADPSTQTSRPVPAPLRAVFMAYEAGEPMFEVRTGDWATLGADAVALRLAVFVGEQNVPLDMERDADDAVALHAVAYNRLGQALATGRLLRFEPGVGKIGRMAVHRVQRGTGLGRAVLHSLRAHALARGDQELMLHAQHHAVGFYGQLGFATRGQPFEEAGIAHREMTQRLAPVA